ncbi:MAG: helix-turn-helix domain-containing protein [Gammaproteobacteria bacterium]|nr:helix-turn-helix domain-containing protein [Gammaproteobacteria bacterium]
MDNIRHLKQPVTTCKNCNLFNFCLPKSLNNSELKRFESLVKKITQIKQNQPIFRQGEKLVNLFVVRTGSYKCSNFTSDGREIIGGFYLPGKILGLNAISSDIHPDSAITLEASNVCEIPYHPLMSLCYEFPELQKQYINMICNELYESQELNLITSNNTEIRLASYLLSISNRRKKQGYNSTDFQLTMSRYDLANYLCMAHETLSRVFSRFKNEGLIATNYRQIKLIDLDTLMHLAGIEQVLQHHENA